MIAAIVLEWLGLLLRWLHVIAAIAWIGASFYFVWLDNHLQEPPAWKKQQGIKGDLWAIHGGGIYEIAKYQLAPPALPATLHWFKWEAYSTWLSGIALLVVMYYARASTYMLGGTLTSAPLAVAAGIGLVLATLLFYEGMMRSPLRERPALLATLLVLWLSVLSYVAMQLLAPRAGMLHVGAAIGTLMAANVLLGIMPAQRELVAAISAGRAPDPAPAAFARVRSLHNNYLTLPVIFCMIGNHSAAIYGHTYGWLLLVCLGLIGAYIRHFFNLRHRGIIRPGILLRAALALLVLLGALSWQQVREQQLNQQIRQEQTEYSPLPGAAPTVSDAQVMAIVARHCRSCHATAPTQPGFSAAPAGIALEQPAQLRQFSPRIYQVAVATTTMPLGNLSGMTTAERQQLGHWLIQPGAGAGN